MLQLEKRFSQNYSARVSYTLAYSRGNTSGAGAAASPFQVTTPRTGQLGIRFGF